jgi:hypothetical protein
MSEIKVATVKKVEPFKNSVPAYWVITPNEDDTIRAVNSLTNEVFEGSMAEFNERLRG